jgi:hypothetical protein
MSEVSTSRRLFFLAYTWTVKPETLKLALHLAMVS